MLELDIFLRALFTIDKIKTNTVSKSTYNVLHTQNETFYLILDK